MRKNSIRVPAVALCAVVVLVASVCMFAKAGPDSEALPAPDVKGKMTLVQALAARRSVRQFTVDKLSREQISQLCWAAQGITEPRRGFRTAPSAGGLFPLELYVVTADGTYHYRPRGHSLQFHAKGDLRAALQKAALNQKCVGGAPAVYVICSVFSRTQRKYGPRSHRYVYMEVGHAGQNILLQAQALGLGAVPVGALVESRVTEILSLPPNVTPTYLIPVGVPAK